MRTFIYLLLSGIFTPVWGQNVLTITDAQPTRTIAPYTYLSTSKNSLSSFITSSFFGLGWTWQLTCIR